MERDLSVRPEAFGKALRSLQEAIILLDKNKTAADYKTYRDSLIQRFEYTMDLFWKLIKIYLEVKKDVQFTEIGPRISFREAMARGILEKEELRALSDAVEDRNMTSHAYRENLAIDIAERVPGYAKIFGTVLGRLIS